MGRKLIVAENSDEIEAKLLSVIRDALADNSDGETFSVGLSGGSFVDVLSKALPKLQLPAEQWQRWVFFFADERVVGFDSPDSTWGLYKDKLVKAMPDIGFGQFVVINPSISSASECAFDYYSKMKRSFHLPLNAAGFATFDLIFLGMGPDGHTASLFPGHSLLQVSDDSALLNIFNPLIINGSQMVNTHHSNIRKQLACSTIGINLYDLVC